MKKNKDEQQTLRAYEEIAEQYAATRTPEFWEKEADFFKSMVAGGKVLDCGCGTGRDAHYFDSRFGYEYSGIDASEAMLRQARLAAPRARFLAMDLYELSFSENVFDGFWCVATLPHFKKSNLPLILQEINRVTKLNGVGFIAIAEGDGEIMDVGGLGTTERLFALYWQGEFAEILESCGFEIIKYHRNLGSLRERRPKTWLCYFVRKIA